MSDQTLTPSMDYVVACNLIAARWQVGTDATLEVTHVESLDDLRTIQSWCDAVEVKVRWALSRTGTSHLLEILE